MIRAERLGRSVPRAAGRREADAGALRTAGEAAVVRAAQRGSEAALEELFRRHWRTAYRAAYVIVQDAATAEDVAQEAFLSAIRALDRFDRRRPFGPWLGRIAANRAIDVARARRLRREIAEDDGPAGATGPVDRSAPYSDQVQAALAALPLDQRIVVVLRHLLGYSPGEIADLLGLPRGTVNSRLRRGLDVLSQALQEAAP